MYSYRRIPVDLRELGIECGAHRVRRLMRAEGHRSQTGYRLRPSARAGCILSIAPNRVGQRFGIDVPNGPWVNNIAFIQTHADWQYLALVIDLFSRRMIG